jgi:serine phosphatase RsbU (regulator of sigma subunit)
MAAFYKSADRAGGDWYYAHSDPQLGRSVFFLADVTGHGVSAAVVTGVVCGAVLSSMANFSMAPEDYLRFAMKGLNRVLKQTSS